MPRPDRVARATCRRAAASHQLEKSVATRSTHRVPPSPMYPPPKVPKLRRELPMSTQPPTPRRRGRFARAGRGAPGVRLGLIWNLAVAFFLAVSLGGPLLGQSIAEAANASADVDECRNGTLASPVACTGSAWVNGNAGASNSHWLEGDSIAYRMRFDNLTLASHTVTIEWDTTQQGKHAIDYLTTYNRTE